MKYPYPLVTDISRWNVVQEKSFQQAPMGRGDRTLRMHLVIGVVPVGTISREVNIGSEITLKFGG